MSELWDIYSWNCFMSMWMRIYGLEKLKEICTLQVGQYFWEENLCVLLQLFLCITLTENPTLVDMWARSCMSETLLKSRRLPIWKVHSVRKKDKRSVVLVVPTFSLTLKPSTILTSFLAAFQALLFSGPTSLAANNLMIQIFLTLA